MMVCRYLLGFFLLLLAPAAWAQILPVINAPIPDDLKAAISARAEHLGKPEPWEYFPLEVGNAWEYEEISGGDDHIRMDVPKDTLIEGRQYFILRRTRFDGDGEPYGIRYRLPVRFDTLRSAVVYWSTYSEQERMMTLVPCPFVGELNEEVGCLDGGVWGDVTMVTDEGVLNFEPDTTITGVHAREYSLPLGIWRYAAGFGEVYVDEENDYPYRITYCRVGGEEFGMEQHPVASEGDPGSTEVARAAVWPNPFRERFTVAFEVAQAGPVKVELLDMLGRVVKRQEVGWAEHTLGLSGEGLAPGVYLVRIRREGGVTATKKVLKL